MKQALEDVIWKSRCNAGDIANYMTAVFGDRMRKRQALIASAANARSIDDADASMDDTSGLRDQPPLPRRLSTRSLPKKRSWLAGTVLGLGVMVGLAGGVRLVTGKLAGRNESQAATVQQPSTPKAVAPKVEPIAPVAEKVVARDVDEMVPRARLRPEHLEPVRVEAPVERVAETPGPVTQPNDVPVTTPTVRTPPPAPVVTGPTPRELYAKGSELFLAGSFKEAVAVYKQALAIDRGYAPAHRGLGLAYQRMGFDALAIESFKRYLALSPGASDAPAIQKRIENLGGTN
jgi:tetratricopeptide (TPR) repeat protein